MKLIIFIIIINIADIQMYITIKQLEIFTAIAETGNVTQAAESLFLTQSACSMALSALEKQLNTPLFDRVGKKLVLNERGKILFSRSANIAAQLRETQDLLLSKDYKTISGNLIIGASSTIGNYLLPQIIADFVEVNPNAKMKLRIANSNQVIDELLKFKIDVGFIEGVCHSDEIISKVWMKDELIFIASPKNPLTHLKKITLNNLRDAKWIHREAGSMTREKVEDALGLRLNPIFELDHTEAIKQAVIANLGISCVSKISVQNELKKKELIELKSPIKKLTREFYILLHKEKYKSHLLNVFLKSKGITP